MMYAAMRWLMRFMTTTYLAGLFKVNGLENVPRHGPLIVCPNHSANLDPPMVPAFLPRSDSWSMAKSEYFAKGGWMEWVFRAYHSFPVVRHTADRLQRRARAASATRGSHRARASDADRSSVSRRRRINREGIHRRVSTAPETRECTHWRAGGSSSF